MARGPERFAEPDPQNFSVFLSFHLVIVSYYREPRRLKPSTTVIISRRSFFKWSLTSYQPKYLSFVQPFLCLHIYVGPVLLPIRQFKLMFPHLWGGFIKQAGVVYCLDRSRYLKILSHDKLSIMDRLSAAAALRGASSNRASYRGPRFGRQASALIPTALDSDLCPFAGGD